MKKILMGMLICVQVIVMTGCTQTVETKESNITAEFADKEWLFYDEVTAEHLCLNLGSDGTYSYHCQCGEPVGDSDLYDKYEYDEKTGVITLSSTSDNAAAEMKVLGYNEYHLLVEIDNDIKDFILFEHDTSSNFYSFEGESYLEGYESRCTVVDMKDGKIVYGPVNYDPEGAYREGPFEEFELAENVPVFDLYIQRYNSIQGDEEYEEFYDVAFTEIDEEEIGYILDAGAGAAFLWFDDDMRVEKIVFWGENSVTAHYESVTILPEDTDAKAPEEYEVCHENVDGSIIYLMTPEQYEKSEASLQSE